MPQLRFDPATDYYGLLGLSSTATPADIQAAYRKLAKAFHPDLNAGSTVAAARMTRINFARSLLIDPAARAAYDQARYRRFAEDTADAGARIAAATSAWAAASHSSTVYSVSYAPTRNGEEPSSQVVVRPWWDRSTLVMALLVVPLVLILGFYVAGAVQVAGRFDHPFLSALALQASTRPTAETIASEIHGQLAGSLPSERAARAANALIDDVGEGTSEALLLRTLGARLLQAAAANDVPTWQNSVARLCEVSHTCTNPVPHDTAADAR